MFPEAMLVCAQAESSQLLRSVLEELGTKVEHHTDTGEALIRLWSRRYDAVVVDCEGRGDETEVVREVHEAAKNRNAVTIAIIGPQGRIEDAYALGAHFVIRKPLVPFRLRRLLRASYALMLEEARRYQRHPCDGPAQVMSGILEVPATLINLSQGGAALQIEGSVRLEPSVRLHFRLPGTKYAVIPEGRVVWQGAWGRTGIRFTGVTEIDRLRLSHWLEEDLKRREAPAAPLPAKGGEEDVLRKPGSWWLPPGSTPGSRPR